MEKTEPIEKELIHGFFIGIGLYILIFGARVLKVLIKSRWKFNIIRIGLSKTFNDLGFIITQLLILILCVAGSMGLYYFYKQGYFKRLEG